MLAHWYLPLFRAGAPIVPPDPAPLTTGGKRHQTVEHRPHWSVASIAALRRRPADDAEAMLLIGLL